MSRRMTWRRLGFLVGALVAAAPSLFTPLPAAADTGTGTLFGIVGQNQDVLARIDPVSGAETQLTDLSVAGANAQTAAMASDPAAHHLFMIRTTVTFVPPDSITISEELLTVNSQNGAIVSSPILTHVLNNLAFDQSTGTLYGFTFDSVVRVDPITGSQTLVASVPNPTGAVVSMAIAPALHTIYASLDTVGPGTSTQIVTVNTQTGATSTSPTLTRSVRSIAYDSALGSLFGVTDCCPFDFVRIDPAAGSVNFLGNLAGPDAIQPYWTATDPGSHTTFLDISRFDPNTLTQTDQMASVNEQTGGVTMSPLLAQGAASLAFETPAPTITPESIKADVRSALASGAISNAGLADSLLAELNAASDARSRGQCAVAANDYQAFINELQAQSGKEVATSTANQLISEAQFLIANCP